jgi:creatinine amidohydrolase
MQECLLADLTWPELQTRLADQPVIFVPCGATEQHGPHLPLGVDVYLSTSMAKLVAGLVGGIVAPALAYGYKSMPKSGGGPFFPGTINLDGATLSCVVRDIVHTRFSHRVIFPASHWSTRPLSKPR